MISLVKISSNKDIKRPVIGGFLNKFLRCIVWTTGARLPKFLMKSVIRRRSSLSLKAKKIGGGPVQRRNAP